MRLHVASMAFIISHSYKHQMTGIAIDLISNLY